MQAWAGTPVAAALAVALLVAVLAFAVIRPRGLPEAVAGVPAAVVVVAAGLLPWRSAAAEATRLAPVVGFLAAVLLLARLAADEGLFQAAGAWMAARRRRHGSGDAQRLLVSVFTVAALTTAVLSLDTTVVLLTPVVVVAAARLRVAPRPHLFACSHVANSGSLLLPVSNLTNLLAFAVSGLSFWRFGSLMALPWVLAVLGEYAVLRWFFRRDLAAAAPIAPETPIAPESAVPVPRFALAVVVLTLAGFGVTSAFGVRPLWAATAGAGVLAVHALRRSRTTVLRIVRGVNVPFLAFVLGLGVVVRSVVTNGLGSALDGLVPPGESLPALLALAALGAALAALVNNLPAVLVLLPLVASAGPGAVLAVLVGVNVGPNLTATGSLATLLWRRVLHQHGLREAARGFTRLGVVSVPLVLAVSVLGLWAAIRLLGP